MSSSPSLLEKEIGEQPEALARTIDGNAKEAAALASEIKARGVIYVMIAARGSSDNAGVYAKYMFQSFNGLPVAMATPSLYTFHHTPPRLSNVLVLGISQSGQSEDIVEVLAEARRQGALTAAVTADGKSPLARQADHVLLLQTGQEKAVAATKTFTSSLAALACISTALDANGERRDALKRLPELASRTLQAAAGPAAARAERYRYMNRCVVISRGFCYGIAMEVALKLKELTYITAEAYSSADFQHGPMAMIEEGFPVILIAPSGTLLPVMQEFAQGLADRHAEIISISDAQEMLERGVTRLPLPQGVPEWLSPTLAVMPGQLLGLHLAIAKGLNPDAPRGLHKVTVTR
jgi:glucosamine--fructose-6-phosphate aminotransferase (isomerizing)